MIMREYPIIDSTTSVELLRRRLKKEELEQYGEAFTPDFVYDVMKRLPRFVTMQVSRLHITSFPIITFLPPVAWTTTGCRRVSRIFA
jgi:ubiquitin carboxyl-terminal hydrolase 10